MTKITLSFIIIFISLFMMFLHNPLSMGLMILMQTLMICLISGMLIKTYWFSYILFLTFMGGLLVLFIYVSSIASNELFKPSMNFKMLMLFFIFLLILSQLLYMNNLFWLNFSTNSDMNNFSFINNLMMNNENNINLNKLYNNQTFMIMMMMVIYLFITLITIVKITNIFYGPLRSKFKMI